MHWLMFTTALKASRAVLSKVTGNSRSSPVEPPSPLMIILQLLISFISFLLAFLALIFMSPPCTIATARIRILLAFSAYAFLFSTLVGFVLLSLSPPGTIGGGNRVETGKWRVRLLRLGSLLCWIEILPGVVALAIIMALQHAGSEILSIVTLIGSGVLSITVLVFAIVPESGSNVSCERRSRCRDKQLEADTKRAKKGKKKARNQDWHDPLASPTTTAMPLTPAPGNERDVFAKQQEERLARLRATSASDSDVAKWKRYLVLVVWLVQTICVIVLVVLCVRQVVSGGVDVREKCGVGRVEVVGCEGSCIRGGGGDERSKTMSTVVETRLFTVTATSGAIETQIGTPGGGSAVRSASGGVAGGGGVKTVVIVTSTTTTIGS